MGHEALSKVSRRDIRRAFSPQASDELFRFVEHCEKEFDTKVTNATTAWTQGLAEIEKHSRDRAERIKTLETVLEYVLSKSTLRERLRWVLTGKWSLR